MRRAFKVPAPNKSASVSFARSLVNRRRARAGKLESRLARFLKRRSAFACSLRRATAATYERLCTLNAPPLARDLSFSSHAPARRAREASSQARAGVERDDGDL